MLYFLLHYISVKVLELKVVMILVAGVALWLEMKVRCQTWLMLVS